eukprot:scaffold132901_cov31-Cyclotella_meneghiniana.AAC.2
MAHWTSPWRSPMTYTDERVLLLLLLHSPSSVVSEVQTDASASSLARDGVDVAIMARHSNDRHRVFIVIADLDCVKNNRRGRDLPRFTV